MGHTFSSTPLESGSWLASSLEDIYILHASLDLAGIKPHLELLIVLIRPGWNDAFSGRMGCKQLLVVISGE